MNNEKTIKVAGCLGTVILMMIVGISEQASANFIETYRLVQMTGEDHFDPVQQDKCDLSFTQSPWDTSDIVIDFNDDNVIYLYARCRVWNDNNCTNPQHTSTRLQYDVWFYFNDPQAQGPYEDYQTDEISVLNTQNERAFYITPYYVYNNVDYNFQYGDILTFVLQQNLIAYNNNNIMDSDWTQVSYNVTLI